MAKVCSLFSMGTDWDSSKISDPCKVKLKEFPADAHRLRVSMICEINLCPKRSRAIGHCVGASILQVFYFILTTCAFDHF